MDKLNKMDFIKTDFNESKYLIDKNKGIKRMVGLGEVAYKPKDMSGLNNNFIEFKDENGVSTIKYMTPNMYKIITVLLQHTNNSIVDNKNIFSYDGDMYIRIPFDYVINKCGGDGKIKHRRNFRNIILEMQGYTLSTSNETELRTMSVFKEIVYQYKTGDLYYSLNDKIIRSIVNDYCSIFDDGRSGYIAYDARKINESDLSISAISLYEFILSNIKSLNNPFDIDYFIKYITNEKSSKLSTIIKRVLNKSILELEEMYGLKVYYLFEKNLDNVRYFKNVKIKVYKLKNYEQSEKSKKIDRDIKNITDIDDIEDVFYCDIKNTKKYLTNLSEMDFYSNKLQLSL